MHRQIVLTYSSNNHTQKIVLGDSDVIDTAVAKIGDFIVEYLHDFYAIFKNASTRVSGAKGKLFDGKTRSRKSRDRVSLSLKLY
jgi:hypothetical protein